MPNLYGLRGGGGGGGGTLYFHNIKKIVCSIVFENNLCVQKTILLARICQLKNEKSLLVFRFFARGEHFAPWREGRRVGTVKFAKALGMATRTGIEPVLPP